MGFGLFIDIWSMAYNVAYIKMAFVPAADLAMIKWKNAIFGIMTGVGGGGGGASPTIAGMLLIRIHINRFSFI